MSVTLVPAGESPEDDPPARPAPPPAPPAQARADGPPLIELSGLRLRSGRPAVEPSEADHDRLDFMVWRGEMVMLTGRPRSGRSGLLNVLGLLDRPAAGKYLLNGVDTGKLRDRDRSALRARQIGFVFQRKLLLPTRSVLDNVLLPLRYVGMPAAQRTRAALESLERVGLAAAARLMTWQLSADEIALCAIARALVNKPGLLLCDDPTGGLDQESMLRLIALLTDLHREGRTLLIATADQFVAAYSSRSLRLGQPAGTLPVSTSLRPPTVGIGAEVRT